MENLTDNSLQLFSRDIVVFDEQEKEILNRVCTRLYEESSAIVKDISEKISRLQTLANAMSAFPSIISTSEFVGGVRNEETLLEMMSNASNTMSELSFPTKSILGRGFLVAKFNFFLAVGRIVDSYLLPIEYSKEINTAAKNVMFSIMAEDVYLSILENFSVNKGLKKKISKFLAHLWEYRIDSNVAQFADVLSKVWRAREQIAPVFGTMLGTSELFLLSMELDEMWQRFMIAKISVPNISMALEEFLFGISYENIVFLRKELCRKGISSIGRQEVEKLLGTEQQFGKKDPRQFYSSYNERRNNAFARKRLNVEGPKATLEDYYILFVFESNFDSE